MPFPPPPLNPNNFRRGTYTPPVPVKPVPRKPVAQPVEPEAPQGISARARQAYFAAQASTKRQPEPPKGQSRPVTKGLQGGQAAIWGQIMQGRERGATFDPSAVHVTPVGYTPPVAGPKGVPMPRGPIPTVPTAKAPSDAPASIKAKPGDKQPEHTSYSPVAGLTEHVGQMWTEAQTAVNKAGQGQYSPVFSYADDKTGEVVEGGGLGSLVGNVGQLPYVGKPLTALAQSFLFTLGTPAQATEEALGQAAYRLPEPLRKGVEDVVNPIGATYNAYKNLTADKAPDAPVVPADTRSIHDQLVTVSGDVAQERAFGTAMRLAYSGPEAVRNAYNEALELQKTGELTADTQQQVQAKHGVWWKEMIGQFVLDPLNLLDAPGKVVQQSQNIKKASKWLVEPWMAGEKLVSTAEVATDLRKMATTAGQVRDAEGFIDRAAAAINPRNTGAIINREVERMGQPLSVFMGGETQRAMADAGREGLQAGTPEFVARAQEIAGERYQTLTSNLLLLASDNEAEVEAGYKALTQQGYGSVAASKAGRRMSYVMKEMLTTSTGKVGDLSRIIDEAKAAGLGPEHVAAAWMQKAADVLENVVLVNKVETSIPVKAAKEVLKARAPIDNALAKAFMGMSFGYAARNLASDSVRLAIGGWSPFTRGKGIEIAAKQGINLVGLERGLGAVGESVEGSIFTTFGLKMGEAFEKSSSAKVFGQAYQQALQSTWNQALKGVDFSQIGDAQLTQYIQRATANLGYDEAGAIDRLEKQIIGQLGVAGQSVSVPPAGSSVAPIELWREPSGGMAQSLQNADIDAWPEVRKVMQESTSPAEAIQRLEDLKRTYADNLAEVIEESQPAGPVLGSVSGDAVQHMLRSDDFEMQTIEHLSESLSYIEHLMKQSRSRAMTAARRSMRPGDWFHTLDQVETEFNAAVDGIRRDQSVAYMELEAGLLTEQEYVDEMFQAYAAAKNTLDREYSRVMAEAGGNAAVLGTPEEAMAGLLRREIMREAYLAGYPSAVVKGDNVAKDVGDLAYSMYKETPDIVPDAHFNNKINQIVGRKVKRLNELTQDEAERVINAFREIRELPPTNYNEIYTRYTTLPGEVASPLKEEFLAVPLKGKDRGRAITGEDLAAWKEVYDVDDEGNAIFRPIQQAVAQGDPNWRSFSFRADDQGRVYANRSMAHAPGGSGIIAGRLEDNGDLVLMIENPNPDTLADFAARMIQSGADPDTQIIGPLAFDEYQFPLPLKQLAEKELNFAVWATHPETGQKIYARIPGIMGEVPYEEVARYYDELITAAGSKNPEAQLAGNAIRSSLAGGAEEMGPGMSQLDATHHATENMLKLLSGLQEEIEVTARTVPAMPSVQAGDVPEWVGPLFQQLRQRHTETLTLSADAARRARDFALLDYRDRRVADTFIKVVYPWSYWHTRSLPNWAVALTQNPAAMAHYFAYKRELVDWNSHDPTIPEWARDQIALRPPGFEGNIYLGLEKAFNPIQSLFDTYENPELTKNKLGLMIRNLGSAGVAPHPLLMAAFAAERGLLHNDADAARSYGYLAPVTRTFSAMTGTTLEPWLWTTSPVTGARTPWQGGTAGELTKAGKSLAFQAASGTIPQEGAVFGEATRSGPYFEKALADVLSDRRIPALASWVLGVQLTPRNTWEEQVAQAGREYGELRAQINVATGKDKVELEARLGAMMDARPWLTLAWMSNDNDKERIEALAKNVFARIPPGADSTEMLGKVGIIPEMRDAFYDKSTTLAEWEDGDYQQFARGVVNLAGVLGVPDKKTAKEWRVARDEYQTIRAEMEQKFPRYSEQGKTYQTILATQGDAAAKEYGENSGFFEASSWKKQRLLENPNVLKYYADPADVDSAAASMAYDQAEKQWPGIHTVSEQYSQIKDKTQKQFFLAQHPELGQYWQGIDQMKEQMRAGLMESRQIAGSGGSAPETVNYIIQGKPTIAQRATLNVISEMEMADALPPPPLPTDQYKGDPTARNQMILSAQIRGQLINRFPDAEQLEMAYRKVKEVYGNQSAQLFAQQTKLYDYWNTLRLAQASNPEILKGMKDSDLASVSKAVMTEAAKQQWPNVFSVQEAYYALPEGKPRKNFLKSNPELKAFWNWKKSVAPRIETQLFQQRAMLRGGSSTAPVYQ